MALNFIKKMFTFGEKAQPAPAEPPIAEQPAQPSVWIDTASTPVAAPLAEAEHVASVALERPSHVIAPVSTETKPDIATAFPAESAPAFTPETQPSVEPAPAPVPETVETAGEAAIPGSVPAPEGADLQPEPVAQRAAEAAPASRKGTSGIRISTGGEPSEALVAAPQPKLSWFQRLRQGLSRTSAQLTNQITSIFTKRKLDEDTLQDLEDVLIQADLGVETAIRITDTLASGRYGKNIESSEVATIMASEIEKVLAPVARPLELDLSVKPHVILVVGVNGTGKTTTIGKLAAKMVAGGLKVTLAAGDTFRAAAIEQLRIWGERTGSEVVATKLGADAAGLAYEAFERAKANGSDILIIDTAGRLQNKAELMAELEKVVRVLGKHDPDAPHTVLQTLDATTGQNAMNQVEIFRNVAGVNGLVMTKLDGSARGGILVAIAAKHRLPVYFIGVGEGIDDLEPFEAREFAAAIAGTQLN
jgi:fused signal recognition particle receptor